MSLEVMLLIAVVFVHTGSDAHNILVAVSHPGVSHFKSYENLFLCLAKKGHNVTVISHFPQKKLIRNYRDISIREDIPYRYDDILERFKSACVHLHMLLS
ncbi:unnamed protein product [Acanthoscelides obtectus]|uniref:Ecdysteroid UDP-glucosyltransferase n=1 Tax=Acanthoscelides obtectus TaxID=200917 RepID=A0A9P0KYY9_ACAOB|nr:unnamed protein product [Acanthoscelides obtectus]CAK1668678.1 hypothetical protein AOBTE_LOCUS26531 [Acanthoscelides obtectus]